MEGSLAMGVESLDSTFSAGHMRKTKAITMRSVLCSQGCTAVITVKSWRGLQQYYLLRNIRMQVYSPYMLRS